MIENGSVFEVNVTAPFLLECRKPDNMTQNVIHTNLTEREMERLKIEGRCFLACSKAVLNNEVGHFIVYIVRTHCFC